MSLTYVHGYEFRGGLRYIRNLTSRPIGFNALIEKSSRRYRDRMAMWVDTALEEGIRFFVTSLGNPAWVVERAEQVGWKQAVRERDEGTFDWTANRPFKDS